MSNQKPNFKISATKHARKETGYAPADTPEYVSAYNNFLSGANHGYSKTDFSSAYELLIEAKDLINDRTDAADEEAIDLIGKINKLLSKYDDGKTGY